LFDFDPVGQLASALRAQQYSTQYSGTFRWATYTGAEIGFGAKDGWAPDITEVEELAAHLPFSHDNFDTILSGRGIQYLLRIEPHEVEGPAEWYEDRIRCMIRDLSTRLTMMYPDNPFQLDISCTDLARLARYPGTVNHRSGCLAHVRSRATEEVPWQDFLEHLSKYHPEPREIAAAKLGPKASVPEILDAITLTASDYIQYGAATGERNHCAYATARALLRLDVAHQRAMWLLQRGNDASWKPLDPDELNKIWESALRAHKRETQCTREHQSVLSAAPVL
jgi:hypothetical protein